MVRGGLACLLALAASARAQPAGLDWARHSVLTPAGRAEPRPELLRELEPLVYGTRTLQRGDPSVTELAKAYGTTVASLQGTNGNELLLTTPGQRITVLNKEGLLYRVRREGATLDDVIRRYRRDPAGFKALKQKAIEANGLPAVALLEPYELELGQPLLLPGVKLDFDTYQFPFAAPGWHRISSGFGSRMHPVLKYRRMHAGLDLPKPYGTPVYASRSGRVTKAGWYEGYGNMVEVRHTDGASTRYGHLSRVIAKEGQWATRGKTLLGKVGSTGLSTGPHLHFEVRDRKGRAVNPRAKIGRR
ncbi:MAG: M23 family metallopeptidase [Elusimicrobia bacterium]|nr:M23 family metallopeptidase [Elusimicrobiota bacterium]